MFKEIFKYYKSKNPLPDFSDIVDLDLLVSKKVVNAFMINEDRVPSILPPGLSPVRSWNCYQLGQHPGLIVIRNPFNVPGQRYWIARCLRDYPKRPNIVNLKSELYPQLDVDDWWQDLQKCDDNDEAHRMKVAMRWATLGYHHNWNTKVYSEEMRNEFPKDLANLTSFFSTVLGFNSFTAEAAIINYYPVGTTLAAHTDHSEMNLEAPLFSFSFGQSAIFLIGGKTKEELPTAIFLKSGDVLVMSHEARLCYHAVPRIVPVKEEPWNDLLIRNNISEHRAIESYLWKWSFLVSLYEKVMDESFWKPFRTYLKDSRININVRQVLCPGRKSLQN